ncbi:MAG: hypothetical protein AB7O67_05055 [Vicinamibacterales bacterium]
MGLNGTGNGSPIGNGNGQAAGANLAYTKFLYVIPRDDDDAAGTRMRAVGEVVARGFSNDFDTEGSGAAQVFETVQFLVRDGDPEPPAEGAAFEGPCLSRARYVVQVCSKYRPRLEELAEDLRRRLGDAFEVGAIDGAVRQQRYSSLEMQQHLQRTAPSRRSGRVARNAIIVPIRKTAAWWAMDPLERNTYFYPHVDPSAGCPVRGHAGAASAALPHLHRRIYYNPDGYGRAGEFDFITYFECEDPGLPAFDEALAQLRDPASNPEWRFVEEGAVWKGKRVLRW